LYIIYLFIAVNDILNSDSFTFGWKYRNAFWIKTDYPA